MNLVYNDGGLDIPSGFLVTVIIQLRLWNQLNAQSYLSTRIAIAIAVTGHLRWTKAEMHSSRDWRYCTAFLQEHDEMLESGSYFPTRKASTNFKKRHYLVS
jgi:hypothetical protein